MKILDAVCPKCYGNPGYACRTVSGNLANTHKDRKLVAWGQYDNLAALVQAEKIAEQKDFEENCVWDGEL